MKYRSSRVSLCSAVGIVVAVFCVSAQGQTQTGEGYQLMQRADQVQRVADESVRVKMELISRSGKKRRRTIKLAQETNSAGLRKSLIRFSAPKSVAGTGLLTVENSGSADDQWLFLPALRRVRRISPADQSDSFLGTDFAFEDLQTEDLDTFIYKRTGEDVVDHAPCYVIEAIPKESNTKSGYGKRVLWLRNTDFVLARVDYFNQRGERLKTYRASDVRPVGNAQVSRAHRVSMENLKTGHKTVLTFGDFEIDEGIDDQVFTVRTLESGW